MKGLRMTVQQVIDLAVQGELKNLAVKSDTTSIVGFINLGLIELYKRFSLSVKEHIITLDTDVEIYTMPESYLWMVAAYGEVEATSTSLVNELPINEEDNPLSVNQVSWNTVQIPVPVDGAFVSIIYRASADYLETTDMTAVIQIPPQLLEPLLHYIGYRAHNSVNGKVNSEYTTHYTLFEQSCNRVLQEGMFTSDDLGMKYRITTRGFA